MRANDIKQGMAVTLDGKLYAVVKSAHTKPGKGPAYVQLKLKAVGGGGHIEKRFGSTDDLAVATLDRRDMEYLYNAGDTYTFMDMETYDQVEMDGEFLGDATDYLTPNLQIVVLFHEGTPLTVELPGSVDLEVTETPPGIKGATVTNQLKEATLETGMKTRVPPFIEPGERIRVSTTDGAYMSRSSE
ncbi:MAG: elongation factor P [Phycisphaeraceae bacterium]|nr:elongation factor P [Phycisphaeraceae bacterium]MCB9847965.1 elongation factor P [Phycisphaeraceae bacterium]